MMSAENRGADDSHSSMNPPLYTSGLHEAAPNCQHGGHRIPIGLLIERIQKVVHRLAVGMRKAKQLDDVHSTLPCFALPDPGLSFAKLFCRKALRHACLVTSSAESTKSSSCPIASPAQQHCAAFSPSLAYCLPKSNE